MITQVAMAKKATFTVIVEKDEDGYFVYCPQLQGCYTQGETYEEAMKNIEEVIRLHVQDRQEHNEEWRQPKQVDVTSLELSI